MDDSLLQWLTRGVFILVFCLTLLEFLRWRDVPRLEVAALFGGLALVILLQLVTDLTSVSLPTWAGTAGVLALLAQPRWARNRPSVRRRAKYFRAHLS